MSGNQEAFEDSRKSNKKLESLYLWAFVVHVVWCFISANIDPFPIVKGFAEWLINTYHLIGFNWSSTGATVVAAGIVSAFSLNAIRRVIEGTMLGWPRFHHHDRNTFARSWIRAVAYLALVLFALGIFGEKYSKSLDMLDVLLVAIGTFLFGVLVNVLDDAISATVIVFKGVK